MENINEKLAKGFGLTQEDKPFSVVIIGENGSGKTALFRDYFENNNIHFFQIECKKLLPLGEKNAYGVTTEELLNFTLDGYDAVLFDALDAADEEVRQLLLNKVEQIRAQNIFVGATCWPTAHNGREPLSEEVLNKYFDEKVVL